MRVRSPAAYVVFLCLSLTARAQVGNYSVVDDAGVLLTAQTTLASCATPGTVTLRAELIDAGSPDIVLVLQTPRTATAGQTIKAVALGLVRNASPVSRIGVTWLGDSIDNPVLLSRYGTATEPSRATVEGYLLVPSRSNVQSTFSASALQSLVNSQFPASAPMVRPRELIFVTVNATDATDSTDSVCDLASTTAGALRAALTSRGIGVTILRLGSASTFGQCLPTTPSRDVTGNAKALPFADDALRTAPVHTVTAAVASGTTVVSPTSDSKIGLEATISGGQLRWVVPRLTATSAAELVLRVPANAEPVTLGDTSSIHGGRSAALTLPDLVVPLGECAGCPPGSFLPTGGLSCATCPAGTSNPFSGSVGSDSCVTCPIGTFSGVGQTSCTPCPMGTYGTDAGMASVSGCSKCPAGTWSVTQGAIDESVCAPCAAGSYGTTPGGKTCTACPAGTWSSATGATALSTCIACDAGTYSTSDRAPAIDSCLPCALGSYSRAGAKRCTQCSSGSTTATTGSTSASACFTCGAGKIFEASPAGGLCVPCPAGSYKTGTSSSCVPCPTGTFSEVAGATSLTQCLKCPAGTFSAATGAASSAACTDCPTFPIGTYQPDAGATTCIACTGPLGFYGSETRATSLSQCHAYAYSPGNTCLAGTYEVGNTCATCPAGTYSLPGESACRSCPAGYSSTPGTTRVLDCFPCAPGSASVNGVCVTCPPGTAAPSPASAACTLCPVGSFSDDAGATQCTACGLGLSTPDAGSMLCEPCAWANGGVGLQDCPACPVGAVLTDEVQCESCSAGSVSPVSGAIECVTCPSGTFASVGTQSCEPCPPGAFSLEGSTSCQQCPTGYASVGGAEGCIVCPPPQLTLTDCHRETCSGGFLTDEADDTERPHQPVDAGCLVAVCAGGARVVQPDDSRCNDGRACTTDTCAASGVCVFTETAACNAMPDGGTGGGGGSSSTGGGGGSVATGGGGGSSSTGGGGGSVATGGGGGSSSTGGGGGSVATGGGGGSSSTGGGGGSMATGAGGGGEPASETGCSCDGAGGSMAFIALIVLARLRRRERRR